nr:hypothetical protein KPHV_16030 [Kitasatospora purpeofusca]
MRPLPAFRAYLAARRWVEEAVILVAVVEVCGPYLDYTAHLAVTCDGDPDMLRPALANTSDVLGPRAAPCHRPAGPADWPPAHHGACRDAGAPGRWIPGTATFGHTLRPCSMEWPNQHSTPSSGSLRAGCSCISGIRLTTREMERLYRRLAPSGATE